MSWTWKRWPLDALRGGLIGVVETVPGVSGGTVALVTGVYDVLIDGAGHIVSGLKELVLGRFGGAGHEFKQVRWSSIVPLLAGMAVCLVLAARFLAPLLERYPQQSRALFFGMIAVSVAVPLRAMHKRIGASELASAGGAAVAVAALLVMLRVGVVEPQLWFVAVAAAIAINALVLPGISGSFLLLILGVYEPTIAAVNDRDLAYLGTFALGAIVGLGTLVKLLQHLLSHRRQGTLAVMAGLMAGSLVTLWPWQHGETAELEPPGSNLPSLLAWALLGAAVVGATIAVDVYNNRSRHSGAHRAGAAAR